MQLLTAVFSLDEPFHSYYMKQEDVIFTDRIHVHVVMIFKSLHNVN